MFLNNSRLQPFLSFNKHDFVLVILLQLPYSGQYRIAAALTQRIWIQEVICGSLQRQISSCLYIFIGVSHSGQLGVGEFKCSQPLLLFLLFTLMFLVVMVTKNIALIFLLFLSFFLHWSSCCWDVQQDSMHLRFDGFYQFWHNAKYLFHGITYITWIFSSSDYFLLIYIFPGSPFSQYPPPSCAPIVLRRGNSFHAALFRADATEITAFYSPHNHPHFSVASVVAVYTTQRVCYAGEHLFKQRRHTLLLVLLTIIDVFCDQQYLQCTDIDKVNRARQITGIRNRTSTAPFLFYAVGIDT